MNTDELMDVTPTNMGGGGESSIAVFEARPDASSTPAIMSPGESTKLDSQTTTADNGSGSGSTAPGNAGPGAWNTKKFRDEYETAKARLVDRDFSSAHWPDPLLPRQETHPKQYPQGQDGETEKMFKEMLNEIRAGTA